MVSGLFAIAVIATLTACSSAIQCYSGITTPSTPQQCNGTVSYCTKGTALGVARYGCDDDDKCPSQGNNCVEQGADGITAISCCCNTDLCNSDSNFTVTSNSSSISKFSKFRTKAKASSNSLTTILKSSATKPQIEQTLIAIISVSVILLFQK